MAFCTARAATRGIDLLSSLSWATLAFAVCFLSAAPVALADDDDDSGFTLRGWVQSDVRFAVEDPTDDTFPGHEFTRNENALSLRGVWDINDEVTAVADARMAFFGFTREQELQAVTLRETLDPWRFEIDAAYLSVTDFLVEGLDLRIGRDIVTWGTGDQFNPTDNLNPDDFEDAVQFGENISNNMLQLRYYIDEDAEWSLQGIWVPIFRSAQIPKGSLAALQQPQYSPCVGIDTTGFEGVPVRVRNGIPDNSISDMMGAAKLYGRALDIDFSMSYFYGRDDMPLCIPRSLNVISGDGGGFDFEEAIITLHYPEMHVLGFDFSTSIPFVDVGLWGEVAVIFPEEIGRVDSFTDGVSDNGFLASLVGLGGVKPLDGTPFVKAVAGMDYTFLPWLYGNVQYMRGFMDEFGESRIEDYVVAGLDAKFLEDIILIRLFGIMNLEDQSHIIYPAIITRPYPATELTLGAFYHGGKSDSKFGSPVVGSDEVFFRARLSF